MSNRPTPEIDAELAGQKTKYYVTAEFARNLERERDEALSLLKVYRASHNFCIPHTPQSLCIKCRMTEVFLARIGKGKSC